MKQFGLGVSTGIDLPNEWLGYREYTNEQESSLTRLVYASFGQQGNTRPCSLPNIQRCWPTRVNEWSLNW